MCGLIAGHWWRAAGSPSAVNARTACEGIHAYDNRRAGKIPFFLGGLE